jgi:hypothetical protein
MLMPRRRHATPFHAAIMPPFHADIFFRAAFAAAFALLL